MVNWGRCVCLRAEVAKGRGLMQEAADLFSLAADKFDAALDLNPQVRTSRDGCPGGPALTQGPALLPDSYAGRAVLQLILSPGIASTAGTCGGGGVYFSV